MILARCQGEAAVVYNTYTMKRFQIYLAEGQHDELERLAAAKGCNVSELVRHAVDAYVEHEKHRPPKPLERIEDHPLWGLIAMVDADVDPDAPMTYGSTTYKEALYGGDDPWP